MTTLREISATVIKTAVTQLSRRDNNTNQLQDEMNSPSLHHGPVISWRTRYATRGERTDEGDQAYRQL